MSNKNLPIEVRELVEKFISRNPNLKEQTRRGDRCAILKSLSYLEKSAWKKGLPISITQATLIRWLKKMKKRYVALYTIMPRMRRVSNFFQFLKNNEYLKENPLNLLKKKYPRKGLKAVILVLMEPSPQKFLKDLKPVPIFSSPLGKSMQNFITFSRAQGKSYHQEERTLCHFDRFLISYSAPPKQLSDSILRKWNNQFLDRSEAHRYKSFSVVRQFCLYLRRFDAGIYTPDTSLSPPCPQSFIPYIYSKKEIVTLLRRLRKSKPSRQYPLRPQMLYILVLLLYTTGMRISEAMKLRLKDIDWKEEKIYIRETKFFKSRTVPLSPSMVKELKSYFQLREQARLPTDPESFLFQNLHRPRPCDNSTISKLFRQALRDLGLKPKQGKGGPRIHDLRHTFATYRLEEWYRKGEDIQSMLGLISTYLGHVGIASTQRYLTMTTELLQQASQRFNRYFNQTQKGEPK
ncbi:MAG: tyrosine-type recombinase/integrase [Syntrophales bacterium]|nr:tyrosine-type recombinase/integrase [Syntrophales bacterium]